MGKDRNEIKILITMRYTFFIFFICINFSCLNVSASKIISCTTDYLTYNNYDSLSVLNEIKHIPNIKRIDDKSFNFYLENGVGFEEMKQNKIIFFPRREFFNNRNLEGSIPLYIIGYFQTNNIKQYLILESDLGKNSNLYIANEVKDKINSMFLAHSSYSSGFDSESVKTKRLSNYIFQINVYHTSDTTENKEHSSEKCNLYLKLFNDGYLKASTNLINDNNIY